VIITVTRVDKRKMILWQSLRVEVNRDTHGQGGASCDGDQHWLMPGRWMINRWVPRRMWRPAMIVYPIPVGLFPTWPVAEGRHVAGAPTAPPR
jgi:hypothetical protein